MAPPLCWRRVMRGLPSFLVIAAVWLAPVVVDTAPLLPSDAFVLAVVRDDGVMLPVATHDRGRWRTPWPGPAKEAEVPVRFEDCPLAWWGLPAPPREWTLHVPGESPRQVTADWHLLGPELLPAAGRAAQPGRHAAAVARGRRPARPEIRRGRGWSRAGGTSARGGPGQRGGAQSHGRAAGHVQPRGTADARQGLLRGLLAVGRCRFARSNAHRCDHDR